MKKIDLVVGLQWGDEGKGKIVDLLISRNKYDVVMRGNGGNNAGHSISFNDKTFSVHSLPSGILQECINIIGPGCVVNPKAIVSELDNLGDYVSGELVISDRCPLILEKHIIEDKKLEDKKAHNSVGTTLKGIGPAYAALKNRTAVFAGDLLDIEKTLKRFDFLETEEKESLIIELTLYKKLIGKYIKNISPIVYDAKNILVEGAQATMLDNLYGTYPYVTSSNTIVSSLLTGTGLNYKYINKVYGVTKFYTTRVGNGPFITEMGEDTAKTVQKIGKEIGVSTGRIRRCGWIDLVQLKYAIGLNGITDLCMMKSDVMDDFEEIQLCNSYNEINTQNNIKYIPFDISKYKPNYVSFNGWHSDTFNKPLNSSPDELNTIFKYIEKELDVHLTFISTGPAREATVFVH